MIQRFSVAAIASCVFAATGANAALVFSNYANVGSYIDTVNAGSTNVRWYSVYTANGSNASTLDLKQLRVRVFKPAGYTGGASIEAFVAVANGNNLSTALPTLVAAGQTAPSYASLGTVSLSGVTAATNSTATWGSGTTTLASIALNNSWSGNGCLFVGFRFTGQSTTAANQVGIRLSTGSSATGGSATASATGYIDNSYWRSTGSATGAVAGPFTFSNALYSNVGCMDITGDLVPAPGALALLGVASLVGTRRRR